jgi:hypothetical protein
MAFPQINESMAGAKLEKNIQGHMSSTLCEKVFLPFCLKIRKIGI